MARATRLSAFRHVDGAPAFAARLVDGTDRVRLIDSTTPFPGWLVSRTSPDASGLINGAAAFAHRLVNSAAASAFWLIDAASAFWLIDGASALAVWLIGSTSATLGLVNRAAPGSTG
ncbi:MAG: hypothetical protein ABSD51_00425, partial [Candidatus Binatus sp.]